MERIRRKREIKEITWNGNSNPAAVYATRRAVSLVPIHVQVGLSQWQSVLYKGENLFEMLLPTVVTTIMKSEDKPNGECYLRYL